MIGVLTLLPLCVASRGFPKRPMACADRLIWFPTRDFRVSSNRRVFTVSPS